MTATISAFDPARDLVETQDLMRVYADTLKGYDRCNQGIDAEIESLPGDYGPPTGALLVARSKAGAVVGCVALHPLEPGVCEMKRLFVSPAAQGQGLGRALTLALIEAARDRGFRAMRLDTLEHMTAARGLYANLGFREIGPYNASLTPGTLFFELALDR